MINIMKFFTLSLFLFFMLLLIGIWISNILDTIESLSVFFLFGSINSLEKFENIQLCLSFLLN